MNRFAAALVVLLIALEATAQDAPPRVGTPSHPPLPGLTGDLRGQLRDRLGRRLLQEKALKELLEKIKKQLAGKGIDSEMLDSLKSLEKNAKLQDPRTQDQLRKLADQIGPLDPEQLDGIKGDLGKYIEDMKKLDDPTKLPRLPFDKLPPDLKGPAPLPPANLTIGEYQAPEDASKRIEPRGKVTVKVPVKYPNPGAWKIQARYECLSLPERSKGIEGKANSGGPVK